LKQRETLYYVMPMYCFHTCDFISDMKEREKERERGDIVKSVSVYQQYEGRTGFVREIMISGENSNFQHMFKFYLVENRFFHVL